MLRRLPLTFAGTGGGSDSEPADSGYFLFLGWGELSESGIASGFTVAGGGTAAGALTGTRPGWLSRLSGTEFGIVGLDTLVVAALSAVKQPITAAHSP